MKPFHPSQSRRLYRAISTAAAAQARADFAAKRARSAASFTPADSPARQRADKTRAAAAQAGISAGIAIDTAERAAWTTGESSDIDTAGAEHAAQQAKRHAQQAKRHAARAHSAAANDASRTAAEEFSARYFPPNYAPSLDTFSDADPGL